jgi:hypothetical protein
MERDRRRMVFRKRLKAVLWKALVFVFILGLAVLAFAIAGSTR